MLKKQKGEIKIGEISSFPFESFIASHIEKVKETTTEVVSYIIGVDSSCPLIIVLI